MSYMHKRLAMIELVCSTEIQDKAAARSLVFHLAEMCLRQNLIVQLRVRAADELLNPLCIEMSFQKLYTLESLSAKIPAVC